MSTDSKNIEIRLDADPRLAAAAAGGARYLGEAGGLSSEAAGKLQSATLTVCEEAIAQVDDRHTTVTVRLRQYPDRIEVSVVHSGDAPAVGLPALLGKTGSSLEGVDRVQYDQAGDTSVTTLVKFFGPHA